MRHLARGLILALLLSLLPLHSAEIAAQSAPNTPIRSVAWSPDDDRIAVGYDDGTVQIVDAATGQTIHTLRGHTDSIVTLGWKPDGSQVISGSYDGTARIWDALIGECLITLSAPSVTGAATWTPDGQRVVTVGFDRTPSFWIWDANTFQQLGSDIKGDIVQIAFSPDEVRVAFANAAGELAIADAATFDVLLRYREPESLEGGTFGVYVAAWSPGGDRVAGGNFAGDVRLWDIHTGENLFNLRATDNLQSDWDITPVRAVRFSADGTQLSAVAADGTFRAWDVSTGALLGSEQLPDAPIQAAAWNSDGSQLAYGGDSGVLHISEAPKISPPLDQITPDTPIRSIAWSPNDDRIAVGYEDGTVQIVDAATGQPLHTLRGHAGRVAHLAWKPDGSELLSGDHVIDGRAPATSMLWNTETGQQLATLSGISSTSILGVSWSLDGSQIITFGFDTNPNLKFWDATTYQLLSEEDKAGDAYQIVWSPDTTLVALANSAGEVIIANPITFDPLRHFYEEQATLGARGGVYTAAWSPDGSLVAGGNTAGTVRIWRVADGQNLLNMAGATSQELRWDTTTIHAVRFSADGRQLSSIAADGTFRAWDVSTGVLLGSEQLPDAPIQAAAWNSDGTQLAYGGDSGVLHISEAPAASG